jgi:hypothetical protein
MNFKEIISVPGQNGLFRILANNKSGFIVEALLDGRRTMINANQRIMTLSDISVYTKDGEIPLRDVFKKMQEVTGKKLEVDPKDDPKKLREYFKKIVPEFDEEKVYASDIKKMFTWYEILKDKIDFSVEDKKEDDDSKPLIPGEHEKHVPKVHEAHGPKAENAKTSTARTRKKV